MQVARPRVVAQAAPQRQHVVEVRPGERATTEGLLRYSIELAPRSISPDPARRSNGDLAERSSWCGTPFRMTKLAPSSVKSVRSAAIAPCSAGGLDPRRDLALRSNSARLTPFRLLSRSARLALPESAFFIALTVAPPVCTSSATLPRPSRRSLLRASFSNGPKVTPPRSALSAKRLVLALALAAPERLP